MEKILETGNFWVRIGMMNPEHVKAMLPDLLEAYKDEKVYKFIHIPVQSGDDKILKKMKRKYTISEFQEVVELIRKEIPDMTLATDVICGYPTETQEQFRNTVELVKEIKPDIVNISRFGSRPGTAAAKSFQLSGDVIKSRSRLMTSVFEWEAMSLNKKWIGWEGQILIDEKGRDNSWIGRNYAYRPVIVNGDYRLGDRVKVKVTQTSTYGLVGRVTN